MAPEVASSLVLPSYWMQGTRLRGEMLAQGREAMQAAAATRRSRALVRHSSMATAPECQAGQLAGLHLIHCCRGHPRGLKGARALPPPCCG